MEINEVIGIDVSKLTLDCCIHNSGSQNVFVNNPQGINKLLEWVLTHTDVKKEQVLFVFENTGLYSVQLTTILHGHGCTMSFASGLEIRRSLGIARGKDDKSDAKRIALYGYRIRDEIKLYQMPNMALRRLMSIRRKLVVQHAGYMANLKEMKRVLTDDKALFTVQEQMVQALNLQIRTVEKEMDRIIREEPELERLQKLLTSVKGIGELTARFLIIYTVGFTAFESWMKFTSYVGIAPFPNRSGTSVHGRNKVSHLANKEGKALLHLCAASVIQCNPEIKAYYERRLEKGKHKMSTLNIIRNKLLSRAFAVVARDTPYVNTMGYTS
tara:strand:+ start:288 stop:1268 length:981 start_codon:yes stop_codon:yes gene_type:complete